MDITKANEIKNSKNVLILFRIVLNVDIVVSMKK